MNEQTISITEGGIRMRRHRERRQKGLWCVMVQLRATEIDVLARRGLLAGDARNDVGAIRNALHEHFDRTLSEAGDA